MRQLGFLLISIAILAGSIVPQKAALIEPPPDYRGNGCSLFPDGNYRECCDIHDAEYFRGGSFRERRQSDKRLYRCVRSKKGWQNEIAAPVMYLGVRVFGGSLLPTPFRWGFGQKKKGS
jgi:hypothetical protein